MVRRSIGMRSPKSRGPSQTTRDCRHQHCGSADSSDERLNEGDNAFCAYYMRTEGPAAPQNPQRQNRTQGQKRKYETRHRGQEQRHTMHSHWRSVLSCPEKLLNGRCETYHPLKSQRPLGQAHTQVHRRQRMELSCFGNASACHSAAVLARAPSIPWAPLPIKRLRALTLMLMSSIRDIFRPIITHTAPGVAAATEAAKKEANG